METDEIIRREFAAATARFEFATGIDALSIQRSARRRRRARLSGAALLLVMAVGAAAVVARPDGGPARTDLASSGVLRMVPAALPDGFVLRHAYEQSGQESPSSSRMMFYRGPGDQRAVVITNDNAAGPAKAPGDTYTTGSYHSISFRPDDGTEVIFATRGVSKEATEAMVSNIGILADYHREPYGFVRPPDGFRLIGDQRDAAPSGTSAAYAAPDTPLIARNQRQVTVIVGMTTPLVAEPDRIFSDTLWTTNIRGHEALVTSHRYTDPAHTIVSIIWFEAPGVAVWITAHDLNVDEAIAVAKGLRPVSEEDWTAHLATAQR